MTVIVLPPDSNKVRNAVFKMKNIFVHLFGLQTNYCTDLCESSLQRNFLFWNLLWFCDFVFFLLCQDVEDVSMLDEGTTAVSLEQLLQNARRAKKVKTDRNVCTKFFGILVNSFFLPEILFFFLFPWDERFCNIHFHCEHGLKKFVEVETMF